MPYYQPFKPGISCADGFPGCVNGFHGGVGGFQSNPLSPTTIESDRATLVGLKTLHDYAPSKRLLSIEAVSALEAQLRQAEEAELLAAKALAAARDARAAAGWDLHNAILGVKAGVISQYGHNSDAVQTIGLKKKSDYRRPSRRTTSAA